VSGRRGGPQGRKYNLKRGRVGVRVWVHKPSKEERVKPMILTLLKEGKSVREVYGIIVLDKKLCSEPTFYKYVHELIDEREVEQQKNFKDSQQRSDS